MVSLREGDREKKIAVKREGERERDRLTDGEKNGFFARRRQRKENRSEERGTEGEGEPDRRRKIGFFA